jgi:hypothetical protein
MGCIGWYQRVAPNGATYVGCIGWVRTWAAPALAWVASDGCEHGLRQPWRGLHRMGPNMGCASPSVARTVEERMSSRQRVSSTAALVLSATHVALRSSGLCGYTRAHCYSSLTFL